MDTAATTKPATFLFTDIEGSTRLWEQQPRAMRVALARHDSIMRATIEQHGGHVFKTVGDAFYAVFPSAVDALIAAVEIQRALQPTSQDTTNDVTANMRVRMALHTGETEHRDSDYFGPTLNRVSRLLSAGHGGQILLSTATQQLVQEQLPAGVTLRDLGAGGLRGLTRPEYIYQVVARGLQASFPPLRVLDAGLTRSSVSVQASGNGALVANPYKGLRAFNEADTEDFYGRENLVARLLARMDEPSPLARFLAITGPSGSGKSSVVSAGLIPALKAGRLPGSDRWLVVQMLPGALPIEELESVLRSIAVSKPDEPGQIKEDLMSGSEGLLRAAHHVLPQDESVELVLVIDQFEEVFTLVSDEPTRVHFLNLLHTSVTRPDSRVHVLVTLRADFYDRPLLYPNPGKLVRERTEVVLPLTAEELERAIVRPAERVGVKLEPELVTTILQEVSDEPGTLPLMQYTLTELFDRREGDTLTLAAYRSGGGVLGTLARRSDEIYERFTPSEQEEARQLFLRLVTLGEGTEDTRRRVRMVELTSAAKDETALNNVVEQFGRHRLLTFDRDPVSLDRTVEVAHEALIRSWERMRGWLQTSREQVRMHRYLIQASGEWLSSGKDASFLASGARLSQFEALAYEEDLVLTREEKAFVEASTAGRERDRLAREQMRRRITIGLAIGFVLTLILAALAVLQSVQAEEQKASAVNESHARATAEANARDRQKEAETQQKLAFSRELAAKSQAQLTINPNLALLLAIEAGKLSDTEEAKSALQQALIETQPHLTLRYSGGIILTDASFSRDGKELATTSDISTIRIWDVSDSAGMSANVVKELLLRSRSSDLSDNLISFTPDASDVLVVNSDGKARLWNLKTESVVREFTSKAQLNSAIFSRDGKYVVLATSDKLATIWDTSTGEKLVALTGHEGSVHYADFSPDGAYVVTASFDGTARLWDARTGKQLWILSGHTGGVNTATFSSDGKYIVTASNDNTARLWDVGSRQPVRVFMGHTGAVTTAAFSPDGSYVITASADGSARVWETGTGQTLATILGSTIKPTAPLGVSILRCAFSPDGQRILLVTGGTDSAARIYPWNLFAPFQQLLLLASATAPRPLTCEERHTYLHEAVNCGAPSPTTTP